MNNTIKFSSALFLAILFSGLFAEYQYPSFYREPLGNALYVEHFTKAWCGGIQNGVDGPSKQIIQGRTYMCSDRYGRYYYCDMLNQQVWMRDTNGVVKVIAGTGEHGFRDGSGAQAKFFFSPTAGGYDSYNNIKCDDSGRVFVADNVNNRLRMIYQKDDGRWWVSTVSGNGTTQPAKGTWINSSLAKFGCAPQFGILPNGSAAYYANYGGIWKVQINHAKPESSMVTRLMTAEELQAIGLTNYRQWKSGSYISPDSVFYWSPGDPSSVLRYDEKSGQADMYVGSYTHDGGKDNGGWRLDARFHTTELIASPSCNVMFMGGGDEQGVLRRIYQDTVKHLMADGTYLITNTQPNTKCGRPHWVDHKGHLFFTTNPSGGAETGILHQRMTFQNTDTTDIWDTLSATVNSENVPGYLADDNAFFVFPNPFNPSTVFHYNLEKYWGKGASAQLVIYNCKGEVVRDISLDSPVNDIVWMADNNLGHRVAAGNFVAVIKMDKLRLTRRVILLK